MKTFNVSCAICVIRSLQTSLIAHDRRTTAIFVYNQGVQKEAVHTVKLLSDVVADTRIINLEIKSSGPFVDNVQHRFSFDGGGEDKRDDAQHSQASVNDFGFFRESSFEFWQVSVTWVFVFGLIFIGIQQESVSESGWADSGHK